MILLFHNPISGLHSNPCLLYTSLAGKIAKRELQRFKNAGFNGLYRHFGRVVGNADMAHISFFLQFQQPCQRPIRIFIIQRRRVMQLIQVKIIRADISKPLHTMVYHFLLGFPHRFGGNDDFFSYIGKGSAQFFFAVRIIACRIKIIDPCIKRFAQNTNGRRKIVPLNGKCAKRCV